MLSSSWNLARPGAEGHLYSTETWTADILAEVDRPFEGEVVQLRAQVERSGIGLLSGLSLRS